MNTRLGPPLIAFTLLTLASIDAPAGPAPSDTTGCAAGARCIKVTVSGKPSPTGPFVAQCRGKFPDFIAGANTMPPGSSGQRFTPELIENATTAGPSATRPWRNFDPRIPAERLEYVLALRNYAFSSKPVKSFTPQSTAASFYRDPLGGPVAASLVSQKWYPAPRMIYGGFLQNGLRDTAVRDPAYGMTLERTVGAHELGDNTQPFANFAVAYYDRRGARMYRNTWKQTPGHDTADLTQMVMAEDSLVVKLLFSSAKPADFPADILEGSLAVDILPANNTTKTAVRLLQVDIAVRDARAGATGWYFATYAYDRSINSTSPWRKMVPVGLMWGNDPQGPPLTQSWINTAAPPYALAHLGVDGRLNGPVDNKKSACMACHNTAQSPSVAKIMPDGACGVSPFKEKWFRNLPGTTAFGRFSNSGGVCVTTAVNPPPVAADYSLQLATTVSRSLPTGGSETFNPCTYDTANPPVDALAAPGPAPRALAAPAATEETAPNYPPSRGD